MEQHNILDIIKPALDELGLNYTVKSSTDLAVPLITAALEATLLFALRGDQLLIGSVLFDMPIGENLYTFLESLIRQNDPQGIYYGFLSDAVVVQSAIDMENLDQARLQQEIVRRIAEFKQFYEQVYPTLIDKLIELNLRLPNRQTLSA